MQYLISYFCPMLNIEQNLSKGFYWMLLAALILIQSACTTFWGDNGKRKAIARVGDTYLYTDEVQAVFSGTMTNQDSASFVNNYINNWAAKQLLLSKARINLPEEKLEEFNRLVENYRTDLYTRAYKEALVNERQDTTISAAQLQKFYEEEKENFRLKENLVRLRFIELPIQFLNKDEVKERLWRFNERDQYYLDSVGVQFKKLNFNDSLWVPASRVIEEIPPLTYDNARIYLKKSQFFELEDSLGVYLARVVEVLDVNDIAPLTYIEPTIRQVLLNRRKLEYLRKLETEIIDEATKNNEFEVYELEE